MVNTNNTAAKTDNKNVYNGGKISLRVLVFIQTLIITLLVLLIPLIISFLAMQKSNQLSFASSSKISDTLAKEIQKSSNDIALLQVENFLQDVESRFGEYLRTLKSTKNEVDDFDLALDMLIFSQLELGPVPYMYFAMEENGDFFGTYCDFSIKDVTKSFQIMSVFHEKIEDCDICPSNRVNNGSYMDMNNVYRDESGNYKVNFTLADFSEYNATGRPWYVAAKALTPETAKYVWSDPYTFIPYGEGVTVSYPLFNADRTLKAVIAIDTVFVSLTAALQRMSIPENGFIYVMTKTGYLIGASINLEGENGGNLASNLSNPYIRESGIYLESLLPKNATNNMPIMDFTVLPDYMNVKSGDIFFQFSIVPNHQPPLYVVNGAPVSIYVRDIDSTQKQLASDLQANTTSILIAAVVVFIFCVTVSILGTYLWILRPLKKLMIIMEQATRFEFTALANDNVLKKKSILREFANLQYSMIMMIQNFAEAVKTNKSLHSASAGVNSAKETQNLGSGASSDKKK
ncbi:hypothetical protein HDU92_001583 [Lobulomyces angularis]|nr:hypothetical protein HDU92_001583 [Lobulomyces angularis]